MKHFANCTPDEFMTQVVKFRAPFVEWVNEIDIPGIRSRRPDGYDGMSDEQKAEAISKMAASNMREIITSALEKNAESTKRVMCLATFTEEKDFNKHTMVEYLSAILEMLDSKEVRNFFMLYLPPDFKSGTGG